MLFFYYDPPPPPSKNSWVRHCTDEYELSDLCSAKICSFSDRDYHINQKHFRSDRRLNVKATRYLPRLVLDPSQKMDIDELIAAKKKLNQY